MTYKFIDKKTGEELKHVTIDGFIYVLVDEEIPKQVLESGRCWEEDLSHENGNYINICFKCKKEFFGYKRRVICKICNNKEFEVPDRTDEELKQLATHGAFKISGGLKPANEVGGKGLKFTKCDSNEGFGKHLQKMMPMLGLGEETE